MFDTETRIRGRDAVDHRLVALMMFEAATLGVMSTLHLSGVLAGGSEPFNASHAGIAEAIIAVVLLAGAAALVRGRNDARVIALAATVFAVVGFIVGLNFTVRGSDAIDIAYHVAVLPILVLTALGLAARPRLSRASARGNESVVTHMAGRRS
jgi:multisubunit Na+/H+ antiporter MnhF subunit